MKNRIREIRLRQGLTLERLAEMAGTSAPQLQRLESGKRRINQDWLDRLSAVLDCNPADLLAAPRTLTPPEEAMLQSFNAMSEENQQAFLRLAAATARADSQPESDNTNGSDHNGKVDKAAS